MGTLQVGILLVGVLCLIGAWERMRALRKPMKRTGGRLRLLFTTEIRQKDIPRLLRLLPGYEFAICRRCGTLYLTDTLFCGTCGKELSLWQETSPRATREEDSVSLVSGTRFQARGETGRNEEEEEDFGNFRDSYEQAIGEKIPMQAAQKLFREWLRANAPESTGEDQEAR